MAKERPAGAMPFCLRVFFSIVSPVYSIGVDIVLYVRCKYVVREASGHP